MERSDSAKVELLLSSLSPLYSEWMVSFRSTVLAADPSIQEGWKWNSLSYRTSEWFLTWNWRAKDRLEFVFHLGAKALEVNVEGLPDPGGSLEWRSADRCLVAFSEAPDPAKLSAFVRAWIRSFERD